ncbi:MAG: IclR family transcriptional regulator [Nocardioidaceae bacterium]|nr:IclR family transcriptional regulator [Nocardioidaceae bacterium]MDQ3166087.1 IclR family transcriptional regulator [Actinomycetota bacterium]
MTTTNRPVATVQRAVTVLRTLAAAPGDLGNNEIARRTGINPSTVSRLLATLAEAEMVRRAPESGRFRLGPRLVELGNAALARVDLRQLARPHLTALTAATGETATLSVPNGEATITVDFVQSPASVRSVAEVGRPSIGHATAIGKVFLAYTGAMPAGRLTAYTPRTITDPTELAAEIALTKDRGWGGAIGEREPDLNALAAPVLDGRGDLVAVLGLQGPAPRFDADAMRAAVAELVAHAAQLSAADC